MTQELGIREVFEQANARLTTVESGLGNLRGEVATLLQEMYQELASIRREMTTNFRWTVGLFLGTVLPVWVTIILAVLLTD